jgi:DNA topoisomerase-1
LSEKIPAEGYTLVICEKPDAARRVSEALAEGGVSTFSVSGVPVFSFERRGERFVVCAAQGHVYDVSDPFAERTVYPVFDVEWFPHDRVDKKAVASARRIAAVKTLAGRAKRFVNACDYDVEGETIGYNILRYACGGAESKALRAKFSALTSDELTGAFERAEVNAGNGMASAGRARHVLDFVWGVNLSRMLSQSATASGHGYRTVSVGRVQGPTLAFAVDREIEINTFVPNPYWTVRGVFDRGDGGRKLVASYVKDRLFRKEEAEEVARACSGKEGLVDSVTRTVSDLPPPPPFNLGDLQKEAYRHFRLAPSRVLQTAERLYLDALISYPRTNSQRLPWSIGYRRILQGVGGIGAYSADVAELLRGGELKPIQGRQEDPAHPAIYPTGLRPKAQLDPAGARLYDLIVRRFLSAFAPVAKREAVTAIISVEGRYQFKLVGRRTLAEGWMRHYRRYVGVEDSEIPPLKRGERVRVLEIESEQKFETRPPRYNQATLLEKMEKEGLGTKATRADIISTLVARGYISGEGLTASDLGFAVIEVLRRHAPSIVSTGLTRAVEEKLERIESGAETEKNLLRETVRTISDQISALSENERDIGRALDAAVAATVTAENVVGTCPVCGNGKLRIIHSRKTHKRFVGCSNYANGCTASAPLPQRGVLKNTGRVCQTCSWPVLYIRTGGHPWRFCVNMSCPAKAGGSRGSGSGRSGKA